MFNKLKNPFQLKPIPDFLKRICLCLTLLLAENVSATEVVIETLPKLSFNMVGIEATRDPRLFDQSDPKVIQNLIQKIGSKSFSPALLRTVRHMLILDMGGTNFGNQVFQQDSFLQTRLNALLELGLFEEAVALTEKIPVSQMNDSVFQLAVRALLLKGDTKKACDLSQQRELGAFSEKIRMNCFLIQDDKEKAGLTFDVYAEQPSDDDLLFLALGRQVFHEENVSIPSEKIDPEDVFLLSFVSEKYPHLSSQNRGVLRVLSALPTTPLPLRLKYGEQAGLSQEEMIKLYQIPLLKTPLTEEPLKRADLYQKIQKTSPDKRISMVAEFIRSVRKSDLFLALTPVIKTLLDDIAPNQKATALAFDAVQIYALESDFSLAEKWYAVLEHNDGAENRKNQLLLMPLMAHISQNQFPSFQKLLNLCVTDLNDQKCQRFWEILPSDFRISTVDFLDVIISYKTTKLPDVFVREPAYLYALGKRGEALLLALLLLEKSSGFEKELIGLLKQSGPEWNAFYIETERLIYP